MRAGTRQAVSRQAEQQRVESPQGPHLATVAREALPERTRPAQPGSGGKPGRGAVRAAVRAPVRAEAGRWEQVWTAEMWGAKPWRSPGLLR